MEETYCTKAIILNCQPFREYDGKVLVYSLDRGKLELVVRGVKKISSKLAGHLEPINLSEIMIVRGRLFDYIGNAVFKNCYINIKSDFDRLMFAGQAINVFNKLVKMEEADKNIFLLLKKYLDILNEIKLFINYELLLNFFILKLLIQLGYKPELYNCVLCKRKILPTGNSFDLSRGGLVCKVCSKGNNLTVSDNAIKILRLIINNNLDKLTKFNIDKNLSLETIKIISSFLQYHN